MSVLQDIKTERYHIIQTYPTATHSPGKETEAWGGLLTYSCHTAISQQRQEQTLLTFSMLVSFHSPFLTRSLVNGSSSIDQFLSVPVLAVKGNQLINNHLLSAILEHSSVKLSLCFHVAECHRQSLGVESVPGTQTKQVQNSRSVYFEQVASAFWSLGAIKNRLRY